MVVIFKGFMDYVRFFGMVNVALCWRCLSKKVHAWRVGRGALGAGWRGQGGIGNMGHQELKSYNSLTEERAKLRGCLHVQPVASESKKCILFSSGSCPTVLLHLLGWERELQFPLILKSGIRDSSWGLPQK